MQPVTAAKMKYGIGGFIIGVIIAMIVGFGWGGWMRTDTAQTMSDEAVLANQAAICVANFMKQPNHEEKLKAFMAKVGSWDKTEFIKNGGWDKMPGQAEAGDTVAQACAKGLALVAEK
jgi:predicted negative regulator of RcsB-dependent stress response